MTVLKTLSAIWLGLVAAGAICGVGYLAIHDPETRLFLLGCGACVVTSIAFTILVDDEL